MKQELWKVGVRWKDRRPDGAVRHSQIVSGYGPGALVDFVDDAAMIAGLSWWAKGDEVTEDRLLTMLHRQERNIEVGVLLDHPRLATTLAAQFEALKKTRRLKRM